MKNKYKIQILNNDHLNKQFSISLEQTLKNLCLLRSATKEGDIEVVNNTQLGKLKDNHINFKILENKQINNIKEYIDRKVKEEIEKILPLNEESVIASSVDSSINQKVYSIIGDIIYTLKKQGYNDDQIKEYIKDKFNNDFAINKMLKGYDREKEQHKYKV